MISFLNRYYKGRYLIFIPVIISLTIEQQLQHEKIRLEIRIQIYWREFECSYAMRLSTEREKV